MDGCGRQRRKIQRAGGQTLSARLRTACVGSMFGSRHRPQATIFPLPLQKTFSDDAGVAIPWKMQADKPMSVVVNSMIKMLDAPTGLYNHALYARQKNKQAVIAAEREASISIAEAPEEKQTLQSLQTLILTVLTDAYGRVGSHLSICVAKSPQTSSLPNMKAKPQHHLITIVIHN